MFDEVLEASQEDLVTRSYFAVDQGQAALFEKIDLRKRITDQQGQSQHGQLPDGYDYLRIYFLSSIP